MAGIKQWYRPQAHADGESITLYEHKAFSTQHHGDPIADVYAVVSRPNSSILVVADGVNWGIKPRLAARCAVRGCLEHLNSRLYDPLKPPHNTQDVFHVLLRSLHSAQGKIIEHGGTTTTLCVAVTVELGEPRGGNKWGLCVVTVGDTLCFVWRNDTQDVHEITSPVHMGNQRNPRDSGGCLGADLGDHPDLTNLCCCYITVAEGDIVFVVSDGVSDNFDPVLLKEVVADTPQLPSARKVNLPPGFPQPEPFPPSPVQAPIGGPHPVCLVTPEQRQELALSKMTQVLKECLLSKSERRLTASDVTEALISHAIEMTESKRRFLEQYHNEMESANLTVAERRVKDRELAHQIKSYPGKLDHATVAACQVGRMTMPDIRRGRAPTHSVVMNSTMTERQRQDLTRQQNLHDYSVRGNTVFYQPNTRSSPSRTPPGSPGRTNQTRSTRYARDEKSLVV